MKKFDPSTLSPAEVDSVIQMVFGVPLKCLQPDGMGLRLNARPWELEAHVKVGANGVPSIPFNVQKSADPNGTPHRTAPLSAAEVKAAEIARDPFKRNADAVTLEDIQA